MVKATLRPVRKTTVVDDIIGQIKGLIRGQRGEGDRRLPSERALATQLGVSRPSVREALRTLELMGVVDTKHGSGTALAGSGSNVLETPFEFLLALDQPSVAELHESRILLEVHLAGRAAERRTDRDLGAMEEALREMRVHLTSPREVTDPDVRFHQAVAAAAHNRVLERIMNSLRPSLTQLMNVAWPGQPDMKSSWAIHEKIYRAIRARKPRLARSAMERHMEMMADELRRVRRIP
jgi:GntR family transcriptional repressor for pyruvate dehydrogenase complex